MAHVIGQDTKAQATGQDQDASGIELGTGPQDHVNSDMPKSSPLAWATLWAVAGVFQGFVYVKCLIPYPKVLADQFIFKNCIVLKMFISAVGFAMIFQSGMAHLVPEQFKTSRSYGQDKFGFVRVAVGTTVLGVGMAIAGSGPTMVGPAIGGFVKTSWALVLGALLAAILIGLVDKICSSRGFSQTFSPQPGVNPLVMEALIEKLIGKNLSYKILAAGMGLFMVVVAIVLELIFDFKDDAAKYGGVLAQEYPSSIFDYPAWPPILAGLAVGFGQLPVRMATTESMGGASSYFVISSTLTGGWLSPNSSILKSLKNAWQPIYNYGFVLAGAMLARLVNSDWALDETRQPLTDGFPAMRMFVGAFLAICGSRFAGGCTCGHGVSGTSELSIESFIGAACIFGGAIATRCIMFFALDIEY